MPDSRHDLPDCGHWYSDRLPRGFDEMSGGRNALPAGADDVPASTDLVREPADDLSFNDRRHDLHSAVEHTPNGQQCPREWKRTVARAIRDGSLVSLSL
jgi:hypothetical protein